MNQELKVDTVRSESSGTIGRSVSKAHGASVIMDSSSRPQPDAFTNSESFLGGVSSCSVTMIEMHAEETGVPLKRMAVTLEASRDPAVQHFQSVHMRFEMQGVSQAQAEDLVKNYQGRCVLYGTLSRVASITVEVAAKP